MSSSIPVLCYHNVSEADGHTPAVFESHLIAIREAGYRTLSGRELVRGLAGAAPLPRRACVLTFDDCHLSNWTIVAPLLAKHSMTGVFFCVTDFVGAGEKRPQLAPGAGGPKLHTAPDAFRDALGRGDFSQFLNEAEIRAMGQDFGFEVHGHSSRHQGCFRSMSRVGRFDAAAHWSTWGIYENGAAGRDPSWPVFANGSAYVYNGHWPQRTERGFYFRRRTDAERETFCREDFARCYDRVRELNGLGDEQYFCWPWGQFDPLAESVLRQTGFRAAFTLERSANVRGMDPFRIHRIGVGRQKDGHWLARRLWMYSGPLRARFFFKFHTKRPEVRSVLYMTDSDKLSGGSRQMVNNIAGMRASGLAVAAALPKGSEIAQALAPMTRGENPLRLVELDGLRQYLRAAPQVRRLARELGADTVHTFHARAYKSAALARLLGARYQLFINRGVIFAPNTIFALFAKLARGVVVNSLTCAEVLRRYMVPQKSLRLVYNSFVPEGAMPPERTLRKKRGVRVLYVGNEAPAKGFDVFLRMARELLRHGARDMEFVAAGIRNMRDFEALMTPELRSRLALPGHLPHAEVLRQLADADILVLSSRQESLPNVLLEAFACSLPVVGASVGGIPELIRDGVNGFLRPAGDFSGMAEAVEMLAADPLLRHRMGRLNRRLVYAHLGNEAKAEALLRVYSGDALFEALPIEELARKMAEECALLTDSLDEHGEEMQTCSMRTP